MTLLKSKQKSKKLARVVSSLSDDLLHNLFFSGQKNYMSYGGSVSWQNIESAVNPEKEYTFRTMGHKYNNPLFLCLWLMLIALGERGEVVVNIQPVH